MPRAASPRRALPLAPAVSAPSSPAPAPEVVPAVKHDGPAGRPRTLTVVREELGECTRCKLSGTRRNIVFGVGNPDADLVFVGEAPGADEDARGEPFVGVAGQLLDRMIAAMGFSRNDVYICNVIKCRPPYNRNPEPDEVAACEPFLKQQLAALRPRMIVALGKFAAQSLCRDPDADLAPAGQLPHLRGHPGDAHLPPGVPAPHPGGQAPRLGRPAGGAGRPGPHGHHPA